MERTPLRQALQQWFQQEVDHTPRDDPRRTQQCLRFHEIEDYLRQAMTLTEGRKRHIADCAWCRRSLTLWQRQTAVPSTSNVQVRWSPEVSARLAEWICNEARQAQAHGVSAPAIFDQQGTFKVLWTGLTPDGPVRVSLRWQGLDIELTHGVVRHGVLDITVPLPQLGLKDIQLTRQLLRVEPIPSVEATP